VLWQREEEATREHLQRLLLGQWVWAQGEKVRVQLGLQILPQLLKRPQMQEGFLLPLQFLLLQERAAGL